MEGFYARTKFEQFQFSALAVLLVFATSFMLLLLGRSELGEGVIALAYLVPVLWSGCRWGQLPGMSAALVAALSFDFLFIPPFYTFTVARPEGWLVLAIFLAVAIVLVGRFEAALVKAREITFMYELSSALASARTQNAVAHTTARYIQRLFQASLVNMIFFQPSSHSPHIVVSEPPDGVGKDRPDCLLPILNAWGLIGEIQIWRGDYGALPSEDSSLLQSFAAQAAMALERTLPIENAQMAQGLSSKPLAK
jgi:K+-sensing histidine kinase KdpD